MKNGFSLIEVMIALAVMSILMLGSLQMFTQIFAQQRAMSQSFELFQFIETVDSTIRSSPACKSALAGASFNPIGLSSVVYHDPNGPITAGSKIGQGLIVQSVTLSNVSPLLVPGDYSAQLTFIVDHVGQIIGPRTVVRSLRLQVSVLGGAVTDCFSSSDVTLAKVCASLLGTFNPVTQICSPIP
jgi:prepilin-type N-terminal cleavage/methylation domain-containing protein